MRLAPALKWPVSKFGGPNTSGALSEEGVGDDVLGERGKKRTRMGAGPRESEGRRGGGAVGMILLM